MVTLISDLLQRGLPWGGGGEGGGYVAKWRTSRNDCESTELASVLSPLNSSICTLSLSPSLLFLFTLYSHTHIHCLNAFHSVCQDLTWDPCQIELSLWQGHYGLTTMFQCFCWDVVHSWCFAIFQSLWGFGGLLLCYFLCVDVEWAPSLQIWWIHWWWSVHHLKVLFPSC